VLNTRKLLRELKARGYEGGLTQLIVYVQLYRTARGEQAVVRFETEPGQQAQVDWTSLGYITLDGRQRRLYAFVMTLCYRGCCTWSSRPAPRSAHGCVVINVLLSISVESRVSYSMTT